MVVPFVQGCSTSYFVKLSLKLVTVIVNGRWVLGEIPPAKWTMEFLRAKNYFSMNKTKLRSLRIWAQLTLSFSNLCPTSSQHQYSLRRDTLARLTIGLAWSSWSGIAVDWFDGGSGAQCGSIDPVEVQQFAFELTFGCQVSITTGLFIT